MLDKSHLSRSLYALAESGIYSNAAYTDDNVEGNIESAEHIKFIFNRNAE